MATPVNGLANPVQQVQQVFPAYAWPDSWQTNPVARRPDYALTLEKVKIEKAGGVLKPNRP
jgi:hypothetical protein